VDVLAALRCHIFVVIGDTSSEAICGFDLDLTASDLAWAILVDVAPGDGDTAVVGSESS
jgi:hypothetical protein